MRPLMTLLTLSALIACGDDNDDDGTDTSETGSVDLCDGVDGNCYSFGPEDIDALFERINSLENGDTIIFDEGTYAFTNEITIAGADGITIRGQGKNETILDFSGMQNQGDGIYAKSNDFTVSDLQVVDAPKDGIKVEDSSGVTIQRVITTWTNEQDPTNGSYGIYPVKVTDVLLEDSEAYNSSDAGIYVGQCIRAIVRNNIAKGNVAGIEIENTQYADVYGNTAEGNTGGLVAFDLPGNPVIGRDVYIHDNIIKDNNLPNFAPGGTVAQIPAGTGTFAMASRRVEISDNTYENNGSTDIAVVAGLIIQSDPTAWALNTDDLIGDWEDLELTPLGEGVVGNFRSYDFWIHDNTHTNTGTNPDLSTDKLSFALAAIYGSTPIDQIIYDGLLETNNMLPTMDSGDTGMTGEPVSNDNNICVADGTIGNFDVGSWDIDSFPPVLPDLEDLPRGTAPYAPYDCEGIQSGPIPPIELQ